MKDSEKYDVGSILPIEFVQMLYKKYGISTIVTDGKYVQTEKEPIACQQNRFLGKLYF